MITDIYADDELIVNSFISNDLTFIIQEDTGIGDGPWQTLTTLQPSQILSESFELKQSICDEKELRLGGCIPSQLKLDVMDISTNLSGKRIVVKIRTRYHAEFLYPSAALYPAADLYPQADNSSSRVMQTAEYTLFAGVIYSCERASNRRIKRLTAFDRMYYSSKKYCQYSLQSLIFRKAGNPIYYRELFGLLAAGGDISLPVLSYLQMINWETELPLDQTLAYSGDVFDKKLTVSQALQWLCELNGVFLLEDEPLSLNGQYATPRIVRPYADIQTKYDIASYSSLNFDEFITKEIRYACFYVNNDSGDVGVLVKNDYHDYGKYYSDNPFSRCLTSSSDVYPSISQLAATYASDEKDKLLGAVYVYRPFKASIFGRWWVQVGDRVKISTGDSDVPYVESIVLSRRIKGINGMRVEIEAKGVEIMGKERDEETNE